MKTKGNPRRGTPANPSVSAITFVWTGQVLKSAGVAGGFNNWDPAATPLSPKEGGCWEAIVGLPPGSYEYRFVIDGQWLPDPGNPRSVPNPFGGLNSVRDVAPPPPAPRKKRTKS